MMTATLTSADLRVRRSVTQQLEMDPEVDASAVGISARNGVVTLTGFIDTYAKKIAAVDAVHQVRGVLDVADELQVRLPNRAKTDQEIAQAVRGALIWDVYVPDDRIRSTVSDGWVTLEGSVDRWHQREDAARVVERLTGVRGVTNRIEVKPAPVVAGVIRKSIEEALTRRAKREANRLKVSVDDGVVSLEGTVDSWAEKTAVERLSLYSSGVKGVVNRITVDPYV